MRVLYDVMAGDIGEVWLRQATERSRRMLGSLVAQGLVEVAGDVVRLSGHAEKSLVRRQATVRGAAAQ